MTDLITSLKEALEAVKRCYVCSIEKPRSDFYATSRMCKPCHKQRDAARKNRSVVRNDTEAAKARKRRWRHANAPDIRDFARRAVRGAIARGKLIRPCECESCGNSAKRADGVTAIQAHHDDYTKPLIVRWLCSKCHTQWHKKNTAIASQEG